MTKQSGGLFAEAQRAKRGDKIPIPQLKRSIPKGVLLGIRTLKYVKNPEFAANIDKAVGEDTAELTNIAIKYYCR